ncbi:hypothetical protein C8Q75DRAFT_732758 [Abortiporus biennis]|nr:hypothetical protein C8Q75DRAFT_732758 [Abortiporus biennis]
MISSEISEVWRTLVLPAPGVNLSVEPGAQIPTIEVKIYEKTSQNELRELLDQYNLGKYGSKKQILFEPAKKRTRGAMTGKRNAEVTQNNEYVNSFLTSLTTPLDKECEPKDLKVVTFDRQKYTFDQTKVPPLPAIHFSQDIPGLFHKWEVSNWLVFLVDKKNKLGGEEEFWKKYLDENSKQWNYQQIQNHLQYERITHNAKDSTNAHLFFGHDLNCEAAKGVFNYKKSGITRTYEEDKSIAEKWRTLLIQDTEIAQRWEQMSSEVI